MTNIIREEAYRIYVTDSLKFIGGFHDRYADVFKPVTVEARTSEEIIQGIKGKLAELGGDNT